MCNPCGLAMITERRRGSPFMAEKIEIGSRLQTKAGSSRSYRVFHIAEQVPDGFARSGLAQRTDEAVVAEAARDVFQGAEMIARPVLRRDQHHEHVHRLAVERVERLTVLRHRDGAD